MNANERAFLLPYPFAFIRVHSRFNLSSLISPAVQKDLT